MEWLQLFQQILVWHVLVFAAAVPVVAVEEAAFLADIERPAHVASYLLGALLVSMVLVLEFAAAVVQEKMLVTMASEAVVAAGTGFFSAQLPHFELAGW